MKLAIIGCGNIAKAHAPCMLKAGFKISYVSGRLGYSKSVDTFAKNFNVEKKFQDSFDLLNYPKWDALLLTCPTQNMIEYLKASININKPILAEKPISTNYKELKPFLKKDNICVGLNRRFYKTVSAAKKFVKDNKNILIKATIPEKMDKVDYNNKGKIPQISYENSIHILDILNYITGGVKWMHSTKITEDKNIKAIVATGSNKKNTLIQLNQYFNSSENFAIDIISNNKRLTLKPIEIAELYKGMSVAEPTKLVPIRLYNPVLKKRMSEGNKFKPGFYEQASAFMNFCKNENKKANAIAKISDLYDVLKLINDLE